MRKLNGRFLMTACAAIAGAVCLASSADATTIQIYGGGSTLVGPYWRIIGNCYGQIDQYIGSGATAGTPVLTTENNFNYPGNASGVGAQNCATTQVHPAQNVNYIGTGSGTGIDALFAHDPTMYGSVTDGTTTYFPSVQYGASDAGLGSSDLACYNNTGSTNCTNEGAPNFGSAPQFAPASDGCIAQNGSVYANPQSCYGPVIQFPLSIDPVVFAFSPVYKQAVVSGSVVSYSFHLKYPRANGSGGLRLDPTTYCRIFYGDITNWNDPALKADNGGLALYATNDPDKGTGWSVPLQIVGRTDSSGTTSIFYRHLATICPGLISAYNTANGTSESTTTYSSAGSKHVPSGLAGAAWQESSPSQNYPGVATYTGGSGDVPGKFTTASGSGGVAAYIAFPPNYVGTGAGQVSSYTVGRIGYIGPDYALPYVNNTGANTYGLMTATLQNNAGKWVAPSPAGASAAYKAVAVLPSTNPSASNYEGNPLNWAESIAAGQPLANPTGSTSYPMVGTTNYLMYQCYAANSSVTVLHGELLFLNQLINTDPNNGILASAGLAALPLSWRKAWQGAFLGAGDGNGLQISVVSPSNSVAACNSTTHTGEVGG